MKTDYSYTMGYSFPSKLKEIKPESPYPQSQMTLTDCRNSLQSNLFLAFITLWIFKEKCIHPNKTKTSPDFWILETEPIYITYNNNESYYLPLRNLKFYGFGCGEHKYKADLCTEKKHAIIINQYNKKEETLRLDKIWRFNLMITSPRIHGEADFEIFDKLTSIPYMDLGTLRFLNTVIKVKINLPQIDERFVDPDPKSTKFLPPELDLSISYDDVMVYGVEYPTKFSPFIYNGQLITPLSMGSKKEIMKDFITEKMKEGKAELSERLKVYILDKVTPMILKVQNRLDILDAFFVGMHMEPYYSRFSHKFVPPLPPPEPSRFLE